jgi:hypothetical protein
MCNRLVFQNFHAWLSNKKQIWRQKWNVERSNEGLLESTKGDCIKLVGGAIRALESFVSHSVRLIFDNKPMKIIPRFVMDRKKGTQSICPHLEASFASLKKKQIKVTVKWRISINAGRNAELAPGGTSNCLTHEAETVEQSRHVVPRFVTDKGNRTESLSPLLNAAFPKGRRAMVVTVMWGIPSTCHATPIISTVDNRELCGKRRVVSDRNVSGTATSEASRRHKSPRLARVSLPTRNVDAVDVVPERTIEAMYMDVRETPDKIVPVERPRCVVPRFVGDEEQGTESISPHLEAVCSTGRRKILKKISVSIKWGIASSICAEKRAPCDEISLLPEVSSDEMTTDASRRRKSPRLRHEYTIDEMIFAWDKGHLYEARVSSLREKKSGCIEYFVHYLGFSHDNDRWLPTKDMMKCNPKNRDYYNDCTSWAIQAVKVHDKQERGPKSLGRKKDACPM